MNESENDNPPERSDSKALSVIKEFMSDCDSVPDGLKEVIIDVVAKQNHQIKTVREAGMFISGFLAATTSLVSSMELEAATFKISS